MATGAAASARGAIGNPLRQRGIAGDEFQRIGHGIDIIDRNKDAVGPVLDQFAPAIAGCRDHRPRAGKAFGDHIAERLVP